MYCGPISHAGQDKILENHKGKKVAQCTVSVP